MRSGGTYVEGVGDELVIRNAIGLPLFNQCFEFSKCQGVDFISCCLLVLLFDLAVAIDETSGRLEAQCILQGNRVPSNPTRFQNDDT